MKTPRTEWALIGTGLQISANKAIMVWHKKTQLPTLAVVRDDPGDDPRGQLWTEDCTKQLNWADYCHYCYVGCPRESSADKGLFVYARMPGEPWGLVFTGEPFETVSADAAASALRTAGLEVVTNRTGHAPKETV